MKRVVTTFLIFVFLLIIGQLSGYVRTLGPAVGEASAPERPDERTRTSLRAGVESIEKDVHASHPAERTGRSVPPECTLVPAVVFPADRIRVRAAASGTIREIPVNPAGAVSRGQVLCRIRPDEVIADLKRRTAHVAAARSRVSEAEADLELAELDEKLKTELSQGHTVSRAEALASTLRVRSAVARRSAARNELSVAEHGAEVVEESLERYRAVAPADGRVTEIRAHVDQYVREGDTLMWIESHERRLKVHLPAEEVRGHEEIEIRARVAGEWRVLRGGAPQPRDNPDGSVTVVFDLGRTDDLVPGQILEVDAARRESIR